MFKDFNNLIKLPLIAGITYFICHILYFFMVMVWPFAKSGINSNIKISFMIYITFSLLYSIFIATLLLLFFNKYRIYRTTTKNIAITITITIAILLIEYFINFYYARNINISHIIEFLIVNIGYSYNSYSNAMFSLTFLPISFIKIIITLFIVILLTYLLSLFVVNVKWVDCQQDQSITPSTAKITTGSYSLLVALTLTLFYHMPASSYMVGLTYGNSYSYTTIALSIIISSSIALAINFFFIYSWTASLIKKSNGFYSPPIIKALLLTLACYLSLIILLFIGSILLLYSGAFDDLMYWLLSSSSSMLLFLIMTVTTVGVWLLLIISL